MAAKKKTAAKKAPSKKTAKRAVQKTMPTKAAKKAAKKAGKKAAKKVAKKAAKRAPRKDEDVVTHEDIATAAFVIYEKRCANGEPGCEEDDWAAAEKKLGL